MINLWVDDLREPPSDDWVHAKTFNEAIQYLETESIVCLSLDHDLGDYDGNQEKTGYDVLKWIERKVVEENFLPPLKFKIHSSNPVGKRNMLDAIQSIENKTEKMM